MRKVTFLISTLGGGGAEGVCVTIANGLAEAGWHVDLVILHKNNATYMERVNSKVNIIVLDVAHARLATMPLLRYIRKHNPSTMLAFNYELAVMLVMLRTIFLLNIKIIARNINTFSKNTHHVTGLWQRWIVKPLINYFYCKVDHVVNQCNAMQDDLLTVYPQLMNKTSVIYNPIAKHIEEYASKNELQGVKRENYLLCVGRLEAQKAFHFAIQAFSLLKDSQPTLRLKIVGQGSLEQELRQLAYDLDVVDRVDFEGFQSEMIPYYLHAQATLLTSLYEGFPNVLVESITLGTPIISFDCPSGPREIILPGVNGYLSKYKDVHELVLGFESVLNTNWHRKSILHTANQFSHNIIHSLWEELIMHGSSNGK